jgi:hypothetical protein
MFHARNPGDPLVMAVTLPAPAISESNGSGSPSV